MEYSELFGSTTHCKPVFSIDGAYIFVPFGSKIHCLSLSTGKLIYLLDDHKSYVTHLQIHPINASQLVSSSIDGEIIVWHYVNERALQKFSSQEPILSFLFSPTLLASSNSILLLYKVSSKKRKGKKKGKRRDELQQLEDRFRLNEFSLSNSVRGKGLLELTISPKNLSFKRTISSQPGGRGGRELIVSVCRSTVSFFGIEKRGEDGEEEKIIEEEESSNNNNKDISPLHKLGDFTIPNKLTSVSCIDYCAEEDVLCLGHTNGQISFWFQPLSHFIHKSNNSKTKAKKHRNTPLLPTSSIHHWHSSSISHISFPQSLSSSHVMSVGKEGVLVEWEVETGEKRFLPRLGSGISFLSSSQSQSTTTSNLINTTTTISPPLLALSMDNNSLKVVRGSDLKFVWSLRGVYFDPLLLHLSPSNISPSFQLVSSSSCSSSLPSSSQDQSSQISSGGRNGPLRFLHNGHAGEISIHAFPSFRMEQKIQVEEKPAFSSSHNGDPIFPHISLFSAHPPSSSLITVSISITSSSSTSQRTKQQNRRNLRSEKVESMDDVIKFWEWDMKGISSSRRPILVKTIQLSSSILSFSFNPIFDDKTNNDEEVISKREEEETEDDENEDLVLFDPTSTNENQLLNNIKTEISCEMITTHQDGTVRRWLKSTSPQNRIINEDRRSKMKKWTCVSHFQLIPSCPCSLSAFSSDGSLLCLVYDFTIFIIDSETDQVMTTINLSNEHDVNYQTTTTIQHISFPSTPNLNGCDNKPLLIVGFQDDIKMVDLGSGSIVWSLGGLSHQSDNDYEQFPFQSKLQNNGGENNPTTSSSFNIQSVSSKDQLISFSFSCFKNDQNENNKLDESTFVVVLDVKEMKEISCWDITRKLTSSSSNSEILDIHQVTLVERINEEEVDVSGSLKSPDSISTNLEYSSLSNNDENNNNNINSNQTIKYDVLLLLKNGVAFKLSDLATNDVEESEEEEKVATDDQIQSINEEEEGSKFSFLKGVSRMGKKARTHQLDHHMIEEEFDVHLTLPSHAPTTIASNLLMNEDEEKETTTDSSKTIPSYVKNGMKSTGDVYLGDNLKSILNAPTNLITPSVSLLSKMFMNSPHISILSQPPQSSKGQTKEDASGDLEEFVSGSWEKEEEEELIDLKLLHQLNQHLHLSNSNKEEEEGNKKHEEEEEDKEGNKRHEEEEKEEEKIVKKEEEGNEKIMEEEEEEEMIMVKSPKRNVKKKRQSTNEKEEVSTTPVRRSRRLSNAGQKDQQKNSVEMNGSMIKEEIHENGTNQQQQPKSPPSSTKKSIKKRRGRPRKNSKENGGLETIDEHLIPSTPPKPSSMKENGNDKDGTPNLRRSNRRKRKSSA